MQQIGRIRVPVVHADWLVLAGEVDEHVGEAEGATAGQDDRPGVVVNPDVVDEHDV